LGQQRLFAYLLLASAQAGVAINVVIGKYLIDNEMPMFLFLGARFLVSSVCLSVLMLFRPRIASLAHPTGKLHTMDWGFLLAQAFTGGFLFNYFFYWGIEYTTATSAGIISSSLPALLALFAYWFLGETLQFRKILAIVFAMLGIMVISLDNADPSGGSGSSFGDFLVFLAMIPEALYSIFSKFIGPRMTPLGSATITNWLIFLMMLPFSLLSLQDANSVNFAWFDWGLILLGGLSSAVFYWAWPKGLLVISASTAAIFTGLLPITTSFLGWYFLFEPFGAYDAIGMALVLISLVIGTRAKSQNVL
jgi:drug/metabolite transporter (DMT)-like permease